jgi:hypothetical protein
MAFIENLDGFAVVSRPVNSGVRLLLTSPMKLSNVYLRFRVQFAWSAYEHQSYS